MPRVCAARRNFLDVVLAHFVERERMPVFVPGEARVAMLQVFGEVADVNEVSHGGDTGGGNYIFEFAGVSGPVMLEKQGLSAAGEACDGFAIGIVVLFVSDGAVAMRRSRLQDANENDGTVGEHVLERDVLAREFVIAEFGFFDEEDFVLIPARDFHAGISSKRQGLGKRHDLPW